MPQGSKLRGTWETKATSSFSEKNLNSKAVECDNSPSDSRDCERLGFRLSLGSLGVKKRQEPPYIGA